jgi:hypothetical protein
VADCRQYALAFYDQRLGSAGLQTLADLSVLPILAINRFALPTKNLLRDLEPFANRGR